MGLRSRFWVWAVCGAVGLMACAQGSPADPPTHIDPPVPMMAPLCGNGKIDPMEQCECPNKATTGQCPVDGMDCASLKMGTGTLLCNAAPLCTFNFTMCSIKGSGGSGSGGTGSR